MIHKMKLRKLCSIVFIILIFLKTLFNITTISTQSKKSTNNYEYLVNKVLDDKSFDLWDGLDKSNDVIPFQSGLKY